MSRWVAARRGAVTAVLGAVVALGLLVCIGEVVHGENGGGVVAMFAGIVLDLTHRAGPLAFTLDVVCASTLTGAWMGVLAARLQYSALRRVVVLSLATLPALWVIIAVAWAGLTVLPHAAVEAPSNLLTSSVGALWFALIGMVFGAPSLILPALLAAVVVEGWTRPDTLPQTVLARPAARRWVLRGLVAAAAALTTFAALNWWRVGGSP